MVAKAPTTMLIINKPATMIKAVKLHKNTNRYTKLNIKSIIYFY